MSPEEQLLPLLSRRNLSEHDWTEIRRLMASSLQWDRVLDLCITRDVYPLAYENLRSVHFENVPAGVRDHLRAVSRLNAFRNQHIVEELTRILNALSHYGIPTIALKGLALAHSLYGDISLRAISDTDILVPPEFADSALNPLIELGYTPTLPQYFAELRQTNIECALLKQHNTGSFVLELHWALLWSPKFNRDAVADLWSEARPDVLFGAPVFRMSPEWEFLLLATHAARDHWKGLKWLADIHDLCSVHKINWDRVMEKANRFGWTTLVESTFIACNTLFKTRIPPAISSGACPGWLKVFPSVHTEFAANLLPLLWLNGVLPRLRYLHHVLFVQKLPDWKYATRLPRAARFLYIPFRFARLAGRFRPRVRAIGAPPSGSVERRQR